MTMFFASSVTAKAPIDKDVGAQVSTINNNPEFLVVKATAEEDWCYNAKCWRYDCCQPAEIPTIMIQLPIKAEKPVMNGRYDKHYTSVNIKQRDRYGNFKFLSTPS